MSLNILGEGEVMKIGFFLKWGYKVVESSKKDDLVIYSAKGVMKHAGRYLDSGKVESKIGTLNKFAIAHPLYCVPAPYRNKITYLRKSS